MSTPNRTICEYEKPKRCRKHAAFVTVYHVLFGEQLGPHGQIPVYQQRNTVRCSTHKKSGIGNVQWVYSKTEWDIALAKGR